MTGSMRASFEESLRGVDGHLIQMADLAGAAIGRATTALLNQDLVTAEMVITSDGDIDILRREVEEAVLLLIARQAPVATDLRALIAAMRISSDLERMGDLAVHLAKLARLRHPESAVPPALRGDIRTMGELAQHLSAKISSIIADRDVHAARSMEADDDEMDRLHRQVFTTMLDKSWSHDVQSVVDMTLAARFYERFGDHAVAVARRVLFLVTGDPLATHAEPHR